MTTPLARAAAALIALIALAAVFGQYAILTANPEFPDALSRIWHLMKFFTILTNLLVGIVMALIALNRHPGNGVLAGFVVSIVMVGAIYHALLAPPTPLPGWDYWTDIGYHTLVPIGSALWWLIWGGKALHIRQVPFWLLWPLGYCLFALLRDLAEGNYPYFFLDVGRFGALRIALNIVGLVAVFALAGLVIVLLARLLRRGVKA